MMPYRGCQKIVHLLRHDPAGLAQRLRVRFHSLLPRPTGVRVKRLGDVLFECDFSLDAAVRHMYRGDYEPDSVRLLRKHLRPGDTFVDVGANIGYLTAIGLDCVGPSGTVHAFEPVAAMYERLARLGALNPGYQLHAHPWALSDTEGQAKLYVNGPGNIGWNTMVEGFMKEASLAQVVDVPTRRLDRYLDEQGVKDVAFIKIDVEGFERPVLSGLSGYLKHRKPPPILCEVAPAAYPFLGQTLEELADLTRSYGYEARDVAPPHDVVDITTLRRTNNILFVPSR